MPKPTNNRYQILEVEYLLSNRSGKGTAKFYGGRFFAHDCPGGAKVLKYRDPQTGKWEEFEI
jgi:hypothetical protein